MSAAHPYYRFTAADRRAVPSVGAWIASAEQWQRDEHALHHRGPPSASSLALASATVMAQLLGVVAATSLLGATVAPVLIEVGVNDVAFEVGPHLLPVTIYVTGLRPHAGDREARIIAARAAFSEVANPLARDLPTLVRFGPHQRQAMVRDAWRLAVRDARQLLGGPPTVHREACCYLYTVPGTALCVGCPRATRSPNP